MRSVAAGRAAPRHGSASWRQICGHSQMGPALCRAQRDIPGAIRAVDTQLRFRDHASVSSSFVQRRQGQRAAAQTRTALSANGEGTDASAGEAPEGALPGPSPAAPDSLLKRWLPNPPELNGMPARTWSPASLAFMGDAVWEMYARRFYFSPARLHSTYVTKVSMVCRAEAQHEIVTWLAEASLTEVEKGIVKWGRNADTGKVPGRLKTDPRVYRSATSLEVLIGYLYVTDMARLEEVMGLVGWDRVQPGGGGLQQQQQQEGLAPLVTAAAAAPAALMPVGGAEGAAGKREAGEDNSSQQAEKSRR